MTPIIQDPLRPAPRHRCFPPPHGSHGFTHHSGGTVWSCDTCGNLWRVKDRYVPFDMYVANTWHPVRWWNRTTPNPEESR